MEVESQWLRKQEGWIVGLEKEGLTIKAIDFLQRNISLRTFQFNGASSVWSEKVQTNEGHQLYELLASLASSFERDSLMRRVKESVRQARTERNRKARGESSKRLVMGKSIERKLSQMARKAGMTQSKLIEQLIENEYQSFKSESMTLAAKQKELRALHSDLREREKRLKAHEIAISLEYKENRQALNELENELSAREK